MKKDQLRIGGIVLAAVAGAVLAACSAGKGGAGGGTIIELADPGPPVEIVNGTPVPKRLLEAVAQRNNWDLAEPEKRERALRELTSYIVAAQAARDEKYLDDPEFAAIVELNRLQGLQRATVAEFQKRAKIDDSVLRAEYDKQIAKVGTSEYDFSHIVFTNEADAVKAAGEVIAGKPFDKVMDEHKKDARQARTFTHIRSAQLPPSLAKALESMKPGETSKVPVETRFGWHVVHLDAAKAYTPPPFDQVKDNLRRTLLKRAGDDRLNQLRDAAKITLTEPAPAAKPAQGAAAPGKPDGKSKG